ncbi:hypothetical protein HELRODRAFT_175328 [Helobdella robusta]|uniref:RRM domain-containing protein n=1 Tax=Helobdella robusta TaxID=6412 RepID=T1F952_HELRO|nr:hypothetical protein HELRODRAFT_175328 [Helobdella robusta]ESO00835.1 hypothetical protein HELRODRAFT_175328 [Helobdella robusta]
MCVCVCVFLCVHVHDDDDLYNDMFLSSHKNHDLDEKPIMKEQKKEIFSVYIGDFTWWTTDQDLLDTVVGVGVSDVIDIRIHDNPSNGLSKGYATIQVESKISKHLMMTKLLNTKVHGVYISVHDHTEEVRKKFEDVFESRIAKKVPSSSNNDTPAQSIPATLSVNRDVPSKPGNTIPVVASLQAPMILNSHSNISAPPTVIMPPPPILNVPPPPFMGPTTPSFILLPNINPRQQHMVPQQCPPAVRFVRPPPPFIAGPPPNVHLPPPIIINQPPTLPIVDQSHVAMVQKRQQEQKPFEPNINVELETLPDALALSKAGGKMMTKAEFEKVFSLNRSVAEQSILRASIDAEAGNFRDAIETLMTAISIVKESKLGSDPQGIALMQPMKDMLARVENDSLKQQLLEKASKSPTNCSRYRRRSEEADEISCDRERKLDSHIYKQEKKYLDEYEIYLERELKRKKSSRSPLSSHHHDKRRYSPGKRSPPAGYRRSRNKSRSPRLRSPRPRSPKPSYASSRTRDRMDSRKESAGKDFYEDIRGWDRDSGRRSPREERRPYRY